MTTHTFSILSFLILCGCTAEESTSKETNSAVIPPPNVKQKDISAGAKVSPSKVNKDDILVTVDFEDYEIGEIIAATAELFELNVVIPRVPEMKKKITYKAENVSWMTIFKLSLDQVNYGYVIEDNVINIKVKSN